MISVCIATYNGEKYIKEQISSILCQLGPEDEIVISDDSSTDKTLEIILDFCDSRIKVFKHKPYTKHKFPLDKTTHNFENAILNAQGDYIFLSDQDDKWTEGKVSKCMKYLTSYDFVITDCVITDESLQILNNSYFAYKGTNMSCVKNIISSSWIGCCMAFRREVLRKAIPFPKTQVAHDLWIGLIASTCYRCKLIEEPLSLYRRHKGTASPVYKRNKFSIWFKLKYRVVVIYELTKRLYL